MMRIFLHGRTDGFILLRTLLFSAALIVILSSALSLMVSVLRQSSDIKVQSEKLISERNAAAYKELHERE